MQKFKLAENVLNLKPYKDIDEFVSSSSTDLAKRSSISVAHQFSLSSKWVPSE